MYSAISCIFVVYVIFKKSPGGWWIAARRLILFLGNWGF